MLTVSARGGCGLVVGRNQGVGEGVGLRGDQHRAEGVEGEGHLLYGRKKQIKIEQNNTNKSSRL